MSSDKVSNDTGGNARATIAGHIGNYRWVICALLFFSTTINYIDRNSLSVLKTTLQSALGWTDVDYGWITTAFTFAYAMFPSLIGFFVDKFGVKKALAGALILWSLAAAAHGLVATVVGFMIVRFVLGSGRSRQLPGVDQGRGDVVSAEGARARHRHLQLRHQRRRDRLRWHRRGRNRLGLAVGFRLHRRARPHMADLLAEDFRHAGETSARLAPQSSNTSRRVCRRRRNP